MTSHPTLSPDGRTLYFVRTVLTTGSVPGNFYYIATSALDPRLRSGTGR